MLIVAAAILVVSGLQAQSTPPGPAPAFEVASVKRNTSGADGGSFGTRPGVVVVTNNTVRNIIRNAYGVQNSQIVGEPDWVNTERFDITARANGNPAPPQMLLMVRRLLAERFRLAVHNEARETSVYALMVARSDRRLGPQLRRASVDCVAIAAAARERGAEPVFAPQPGNRPACGTRSNPGIMMATGVTMPDLARNLERPAQRIVVDRTSLTGYWDLDLTYAFDQPIPPGAPAPPADAPSLFTAIQEQLGLRLVAQKLPVDVLVIDAVERPTDD